MNKSNSNNYDPLVEVAVSYIPDTTTQLSEEQMKEVRDIFQKYIENNQTYMDTKEQLLRYFPNPQPLDKLKAILDVDEVPIPLSPSFDEPGANSRKKTRTWTNMEDMRLLKAIHKLGLENWNEVSQFVGNGRTRSQCSQRWIRVLDPRISKSNWTKEEEAKLVELVLLYGEKSWAKVSSKMGNRSDVQCRYRFQQIPKAQIMQFQKDSSSDSFKLSTKEEKPVKIAPQNAIARAKSTMTQFALPSRNQPQTLPQISFTQKIPLVQQQTNSTSTNTNTTTPLTNSSSTSSLPINQQTSTETSLTNSASSLMTEPEVNYIDQTPLNDMQSDLLVVPEDIKFDDRIPLAASTFDIFKSDQLFDSSFWIH